MPRLSFTAYAPIAVLVLACFASGQAAANDTVFDELRFGTSVSVGSGDGKESGFAPSLTVFFDPFAETQAEGWREIVLQPRLYLGASIGTGDTASQVYSGVSFDIDVTDKFFLELGLGGTVHDGALKDDGSSGPKLGCRLLFREYAAAGYRFDDNWQILATVDHSSHANLCDGPNDGLTHAGIAIGYKF
ncbi:acyloxyacyl hydrolase [Rhizobium sp. 32-5/1]|uniref:acyloxyacyl hydrolase n=1 Tax=Rhizobium sp. 32-5/1 TaxID=3019602 RepID=UPI00240D1045|nr:acyloxyacyl hydrolase [Rhizobium sp. 32-5/1]WEZ83578.1 acyloxyacyl hydrolase [Rhizobium sp. 32-5/1]